jgi:uncharacterized protein GlcG (DUF336 family)
MYHQAVLTALGFRAYTGWAVAVAVVEKDGRLQLIERRRIPLLPAGLPTEVYHAATRLGGEEARSLIQGAVEAAVAEAGAAVANLVGAVKPAGAGLVVKRGPPPDPPRHARMSHTGCHAAEGELYRYALLRGIEGAGLAAMLVPEAEMIELAYAVLGLGERDLNAALLELGKSLGPPWTEREKSAALAAWLALAGASQA